MFHEVVGDAADERGESTVPTGESSDVTAPELRSAFAAALREAAAEAGRTRLTSDLGLDAASVDAALDGDVDELTVADGAAVLALSDDRDADVAVAELRDHLLMGMTTAVLDVDTIAAGIDADLTGQEVQQALEGRAAMTVGELAEIAALIERRKR
ncbi:hypothetical protein EXE53_22420 [Halorubrum sp. SD626R]|uniref:DUF5791 family protein n=1 Tax=Halorubrum sp. SD626R TaxID=1419722 RepID=UPI0010F7D584|nr:DUF5791 family protein [Halorubrum sp. SD626R]TKX78206.1 hypothetical protein EXE53_22420 [Halorubrum sp. SD626R]